MIQAQNLSKSSVEAEVDHNTEDTLVRVSEPDISTNEEELSTETKITPPAKEDMEGQSTVEDASKELTIQQPEQIILSTQEQDISIRAVQNNSGMSDEALLLRRLLGHVNG